MKRSIVKFVKLALVLGTAGCLLTGCAWSVGGKEGQMVHNPTRGQELIDLKKALDLGAISEEEYESQRQRIMDQ